jgi:exosome complex exonuclease RRP6
VACVAQTLQGLEETPLTYVDSLEALHALAAKLGSAKEIAVDLEAHSYRSFQVRHGPLTSIFASLTPL